MPSQTPWTEPEVQPWGQPPWQISFQPRPAPPFPTRADFAVIGGGFTGLAAAAWLARQAPGARVVLLEARRIGAGASGRTGGVVMGETAAGNLPGLGDVLAGFGRILHALEVDCRLSLSGVWEIAHSNIRADSPFRWQDYGELGVVGEVAGGSVDAGRLVSGLARAAELAGVSIWEQTPVLEAEFVRPILLSTPRGKLAADKVLLATDAESLELSRLAGRVQPCLTLAVATEPLDTKQLAALGPEPRRPFYTVDLPYLWGRLLDDGGAIFGSGLVFVEDWRELARVDVHRGEARWLLEALEQRVRGLHPALRTVRIRHRWGGPMSLRRSWKPVFSRHARSAEALVVGCYCGHGVAQSVYFGAWAAEVLLGQRALPEWEPHESTDERNSSDRMAAR
ncbi:MAG: FAD-binding oxidoreductase [Firmicutes bacterium]|nr:FAD-binding oxidoreductase [Bacillota bacterium]